MNRTFITIVLTALVTSACWYVATELRHSIQRVWLISSVKAPGSRALAEIEADLLAGRSDAAKAKLAALRKQWDVFDSEPEFTGPAIGNIATDFQQIGSAPDAPKQPEQ